MIVVGLTGSIGMGKSSTAEMFRRLGAPVHDSDAVVHALYAGRAAPLIEAAFPGTVREGVVDRAALRQALKPLLDEHPERIDIVLCGDEAFRRRAGQAAAYGLSDVIRSEGYRNLQNSEAAKNWEDAKTLEIQNRMRWTETYFEMRKTQPDVARIGRLMRRYVYAVGFQGLLQVAIIVVMARFVTGL